MGSNFTLFDLILFRTAYFSRCTTPSDVYLNLRGGSLITADFQCENPYFSFQNKNNHREYIRPTEMTCRGLLWTVKNWPGLEISKTSMNNSRAV